LEKAAFAKEVEREYGWGKRRLQEFSMIGDRFPKKKAIIDAATAASVIEQFDVSIMDELCQVGDDILRSAAESGMFDVPVSKAQVRTLSTEGKTPKQKQEEPKKTDLQKVRAMMDVAKKNIDA
jgi:hypothetical protein